MKNQPEIKYSLPMMEICNLKNEVAKVAYQNGFMRAIELSDKDKLFPLEPSKQQELSALKGAHLYPDSNEGYLLQVLKTIPGIEVEITKSALDSLIKKISNDARCKGLLDAIELS